MERKQRVHRDHDSLTKTLDFSGYLARPDHLRLIDHSMEHSLLFNDDNGNLLPTTVAWTASLSDGDRRRFTSLDDLLAFPNLTQQRIISLSVVRRDESSYKLSVDFGEDGTVTAHAFGPEDMVGSALNDLRPNLRVVDQDYPWYANNIILSSAPRFAASVIFLLAFSGLISLIVLYLYGRATGVNVDPGLSMTRAEYYQRVEQAIRSPDVSEKLNMLLLANFRGFIQISDYLRGVQNAIIIVLFIMAAAKIADWVLGHLRRFYPRSYFAVGQQVDVYARLEHSRDIWVIVIGLGLLVNIAAGIVISLIGRYNLPR